MGIMQAKCKISTVLEIKPIAHTFLARNKKEKEKSKIHAEMKQHVDKWSLVTGSGLLQQK